MGIPKPAPLPDGDDMHDHYLEAAKLAATNKHREGACVCLRDAVEKRYGVCFAWLHECPQVREFSKMFLPREAGLYGFWFEDDETTEKEAQNRRVIALLLAHQMHLDGQMK